MINFHACVCRIILSQYIKTARQVNRNKQTMGYDKARNYMYTALTATNETARNTNFANTFQAVGYGQKSINIGR